MIITYEWSSKWNIIYYNEQKVSFTLFEIYEPTANYKNANH